MNGSVLVCLGYCWYPSIQLVSRTRWLRVDIMECCQEGQTERTVCWSGKCAIYPPPPSMPISITTLWGYSRNPKDFFFTKVKERCLFFKYKPRQRRTIFPIFVYVLFCFCLTCSNIFFYFFLGGGAYFFLFWCICSSHQRSAITNDCWSMNYFRITQT